MPNKTVLQSIIPLLLAPPTMTSKIVAHTKQNSLAVSSLSATGPTHLTSKIVAYATQNSLAVYSLSATMTKFGMVTTSKFVYY